MNIFPQCWIQSKNEKSGYFPPSLHDNDITFQRVWKFPVDMAIKRDGWQSVNKVQAALQMTGQAFLQKNGPLFIP